MSAMGAVTAALAGCSADPPILTIEVIPGLETDAFSREPAVTRVDVTAQAVEGDLSLKASAAPGGSFDFGEVPEDRLFTFEVTGVDATGATIVRGRSLSGILLSAVGGGVVPVFAQRLGEWARPPAGLPSAQSGATATTLAERFLVSAGGSPVVPGQGGPTATAFYDLFAYQGAMGPDLPRAARSLVTGLTVLLILDDTGATWVDFETGYAFDVSLPAGLKSFADVAGGRTIDAPDGRSFVVGATRREGASKAVLEVGADGSLSALSLSAARAGAAAVWVEDMGLVIAGGNATEPGVEVLAPAATTFVSRPFMSDPTEGAGAVVTDPERIALVGGVLDGAPAPTRSLDLRCSEACESKVEPAASLPVALTGVVAYAFGSGRVIVIGEEVAGAGMTMSFLVDLSAPASIELPLREPRKGASHVPAPNGTLTLLGGAHADGTPALSIEMLFPPPNALPN